MEHKEERATNDEHPERPDQREHAERPEGYLNFRSGMLVGVMLNNVLSTSTLITMGVGALLFNNEPLPPRVQRWVGAPTPRALGVKTLQKSWNFLLKEIGGAGENYLWSQERSRKDSRVCVPITLICGYRGHGKDTLFHQLQALDATINPRIPVVPFNWTVYRKSDNVAWPFHAGERVFHRSFAGRVKEEALEYIKRHYGEDSTKRAIESLQGTSGSKSLLETLPFLNTPTMRVATALVGQQHPQVVNGLNNLIQKSLTLEDLEAHKEAKIFDNGTRSVRDIYIAIGEEGRRKNPDHWCSKALEVPHEGHLVVTDFRFTNEFRYTKKVGASVNTIRVFRSVAPIPPIDVGTEHDLDKALTDFLLVPEVEHAKEFAKAVELFPQYRDYVRLVL